MAFAGIRSFPNEKRRTSWRLESIRQLPYSMSSVLSGLRRRRLSKHQLIWLAFRCFNGIDKTSELILSACPTEVKKRLNSSATVLSSLLNDLWLVDFLGIHDLLTWSAMDSRSVCLISLLTLRLRLLYFIQASRLPVLLADFRQYSLIFISSLILSVIYRFGWLSNFNFFFLVCVHPGLLWIKDWTHYGYVRCCQNSRQQTKGLEKYLGEKTYVDNSWNSYS